MPGDALTLVCLSSMCTPWRSVPSVKLFILGKSVGNVPLIPANGVSVKSSDLSRETPDLPSNDLSGSGVGNSILLNGVAGPGSAEEDMVRFLPVIVAKLGKHVVLVVPFG